MFLPTGLALLPLCLEPLDFLISSLYPATADEGGESRLNNRPRLFGRSSFPMLEGGAENLIRELTHER
jgi:hypothetical protein